MTNGEHFLEQFLSFDFRVFLVPPPKLFLFFEKPITLNITTTSFLQFFQICHHLPDRQWPSIVALWSGSFCLLPMFWFFIQFLAQLLKLYTPLIWSNYRHYERMSLNVFLVINLVIVIAFWIRYTSINRLGHGTNIENVIWVVPAVWIFLIKGILHIKEKHRKLYKCFLLLCSIHLGSNILIIARAMNYMINIPKTGFLN